MTGTDPTQDASQDPTSSSSTPWRPVLSDELRAAARQAGAVYGLEEVALVRMALAWVLGTLGHLSEVDMPPVYREHLEGRIKSKLNREAAEVRTWWTCDCGAKPRKGLMGENLVCIECGKRMHPWIESRT